MDTSEIGKLAVWSVTSAKPGNGVELLRDNNLDTYWQSDGAQPHLVNIQFQKKVKLHELAIYADYKLDESYTPSKISAGVGSGRGGGGGEREGVYILPFKHTTFCVRECVGTQRCHGDGGAGKPPSVLNAQPTHNPQSSAHLKSSA